MEASKMATATQTWESAAGVCRPKILVVDNIPENLAVMEALLGYTNAAIVCVESGPEALARMNMEEYAVVLLDVAMPEMNGFQVAKAMSAYRMGRSAEAIEWAEKTLRGTIIYPDAHAYAILAMADWQLGRKDAARVALAKGDSLTPKISPTNEAVDLGDSWVAWLEARISLDEAGQLIPLNAETK